MNEILIVAVCFGVVLSFGIILGLFLFYVFMRMKEFEKFVKNFPSPEDMALQILKTKIPISKLTEEQKGSILESMEKQKNKADYFG